MAQLVRYTSLGSEGASLTFVLPSALCRRDAAAEILSRDFVFAGLRWRLCVSKRDGAHVSPYLELQSQGLHVALDYSFHLLNRESFTGNEKFSERGREFGPESRKHGKRTFVSLADLERRRGFANARREFLMEVTLQRPRIRLQAALQLAPPDPAHLDYRQYDSPRFAFGDHEWQLSFCPNMDAADPLDPDQPGLVPPPCHLFQLQRIGASEHLTRIRYKLLVGQGPEQRQWSSGRREETLAYNGAGPGVRLSDDYRAFLTGDSQLCLTLHLFHVAAVSEVKLTLGAEKERAEGGRALCRDRDRQAWSVSAWSGLGDDEYLSLWLHYSDMANVPAGYLRYVSAALQLVPWSAERAEDGGSEPVALPAAHSPLHNYYAQTGQHDRGTQVRFPVTRAELQSPASRWSSAVTAGGHREVRVEVEWLGSQLLLGPTYSAHDDVIRKHVWQMRREVAALQQENEALEKEMHRYQVSMSQRSASSAPNTNGPARSTATHNGHARQGSSKGPPRFANPTPAKT